MRAKLLGLVFLAPWLFFVVYQPLIQPFSQDQLTSDENGDDGPAASLWWVTEAPFADDAKAALASLCWEQPVDAAFEFVRGAVCGGLAASSRTGTKAVSIHELLRVYLI